MRVAVATTSYPRFDGDYAGGFVRDLNVGLRGLGVETTTFAPFHSETRDSDEDAGGAVVRVESPHPADAALFYGDGMEANARAIGAWGAFRSVTRWSRALRARVEAVSTVAPFDAVLAHWLIPTARALVEIGPPVFGVCHGGDARLLSRGLSELLLGSGLRRGLRGVVAVSSAAAAIVRRKLGVPAERMCVSPMGIDVAAYRPKSDDPPRERDLIACVGRLIPVKGFDVLLRAVAAVSERGGPKLRVVVVGDGPERGALERAARELDVDARFCGVVSRAAVGAIMRRASVVAAPSRVLPGGRVEGTPTVVLEALAAGAAVIGCATGGLVDVLPAASLALPDDVPAFARLISAALARPDDFCSKDATRDFDRNVVAARVLEFMRGALAASR